MKIDWKIYINLHLKTVATCSMPFVSDKIESTSKVQIDKIESAKSTMLANILHVVVKKN